MKKKTKNKDLKSSDFFKKKIKYFPINKEKHLNFHRNIPEFAKCPIILVFSLYSFSFVWVKLKRESKFYVVQDILFVYNETVIRSITFLTFKAGPTRPGRTF